MDFILILTGILVVIAFMFASIEKPYLVAAFLVFSFVYSLNIELPGPLDSRGLMTVILFARLILFDKRNFDILKNYFLKDLNIILLLLFFILGFYTTYSWYGGLSKLVKLNALLLISLMLGFIIIINGQGRKVFFNAILMGGIFLTLDILYSVVVHSSLRVRGLQTLVFGDSWGMNHNYIGFICAQALILVYIFFIRKQLPRIISFVLMLVLSLGLLISTSRSSLLALIFVLIISFFVQREIQFNLNKIIMSFFGFILFLASFYFIYNAFLSSGNLKTSFIDQTYYRLYEEPMSLFGGNERQVFDKWGNKVQGTTNWRLTRAVTDFEKYNRLDLETKLLGLGIGGYMITEFGGDKYNAHNGYVLILVERGIIGLLIYLAVVITLIIKSLKLLRKGVIEVPIIYTFLITIFFSIANNSELTNSIAFLYIGAMIANTKESLIIAEEENSEEEDLSTQESSLIPLSSQMQNERKG